MASGEAEIITPLDINRLAMPSEAPEVRATPKRKADDPGVATSDGCVTPDITAKVIKDDQKEKKESSGPDEKQQQPKGKKSKNGEPERRRRGSTASRGGRRRVLTRRICHSSQPTEIWSSSGMES